ncbi:YkvA family protein [Clostridium tyrobutyricum]|uniref:YkvA family protein n=1 Tax=Clostridium tyrobutyricum TaxID=1519 RepID=UPI0011C8A1BB|nr:YkvA family protein [Clostridium tyrobutyricum]
MKISAAKFKLTDQDVLSLITDYIHLDGVEIKNILIDEIITIEGNYTNKLKMSFQIKIGLGNIKDNILNLKIYNLKVYKLKIFNSIKDIISKNILKKFFYYGIEVDKDTVSIDLNTAVKLIPRFNLKLVKMKTFHGQIEVEVKDIEYQKDKEFPNLSKSCELSPKNSSINSNKYVKLRENIIEKLPSKFSKLAEYIMFMPDILILFWRLFKDKRVSSPIKIVLVNAILYIISPVDLIPGFIPIIGQMDDVAVAFFALNYIIDKVPREIILENWQGKNDVIIMTQEVIKYITEIVGMGNISKISDLIKSMLKKPSKKYITNEQYRNIYTGNNGNSKS